MDAQDMMLQGLPINEIMHDDGSRELVIGVTETHNALQINELLRDSKEWLFVDEVAVGWSDYAVEVIPTPKFTYHGAGQCSKCSDPQHLFSIEQFAPLLHADFGDRVNRCLACIHGALRNQINYENQRGYSRNQWSTLYRYVERNFAEIRRTHGTDEHDCVVCNQVVLENFPNSGWRPTKVLDTSGQERLVHERCSFTCHECLEKVARYSPWMYVSREFSFHQTYVVYNHDTCGSCYERISNETGLFECAYCMSFQDEDERRQFGRGGVCDSCYANRYTCDDCDNEYIAGHDHYCDSGSVINDYSHMPRLIFHNASQDTDVERKLYFGFELEIEAEGDYSRFKLAKQALSSFGDSHVYCKNDGSLDNGVEIVTHPHTLRAYQTNFNWDGLRELTSMGARSWHTDTCGLHVHVNRDTFGVTNKEPAPTKKERVAHMMRFSKLIYDNEHMITQLAGRESEDYAKFSHKGNLLKMLTRGSDDRFQAVNSCPSFTLEVRVFKGSMRATRVLSAIELVHASVEYTRNMQVKPNSFAWVKFMGYLSDNVEKYPNLFTIMSEIFNKGYSQDGDN